MHASNWIVTAASVSCCLAACSSDEVVRRDSPQPDNALPDGAVVMEADGAVMGTVINLGPTADAGPPMVGPLPDFHQALLGPGVTSADIARFDAAPAGSCKGPRIDYPLEGAVMPRNVFPPKIMWTPQHSAQASDLYRVRLKRPNATLDG